MSRRYARGSTPRRRELASSDAKIAFTAPAVGDVAAGKSLVGLYSLVATCDSLGTNPFD